MPIALIRESSRLISSQKRFGLPAKIVKRETAAFLIGARRSVFAVGLKLSCYFPAAAAM